MNKIINENCKKRKENCYIRKKIEMKNFKQMKEEFCGKQRHKA